MFKNRERQGEVFIIAEAFLWGLFPVVTILAFKQISPLVTYAWSSLFSLITFATLITVRKKWREVTDLVAIKDILKATFFIGFCFYGFFFWGLTRTTAGNAALLSLTELFFTFLLFNVLRKEHISRKHIIGAILMLFGAGLVLFPNFSHFLIGDALIVIATLFAPFGNLYQQRARKRVSSETMMFVRDVVVAVVAFGAAAVLDLGASPVFVKESLLFLMVNGILLFGLSKIFWVESIHRISVTKASALGSIYPVFSLLFAWWFLKDMPTVWQLAAFIPLFAGVLLLNYRGSLKEAPVEVG